jgi:hypothetical protein
MTTLAKIEANRTNGKLSGGPKSARGKEVVKLNAVSHGLRSLSPVLPGERPADWTRHRDGVLAALNPVGALEAELAERAALLMWRLRRIVRFETAVTSSAIENVVARVRGETEDDDSSTFFNRSPAPRTFAVVRRERDAAREKATCSAATHQLLLRLNGVPDDHRITGEEAFQALNSIGTYSPGDEDEPYRDIDDSDFLESVGVPEEWQSDAEQWNGWTAGMVRAGAKILADDSRVRTEVLMERVLRFVAKEAQVQQQEAEELESELGELARTAADAERVARDRALLANEEMVEKVMRYESHLNKQLTQTLHQLERWQGIRTGDPPAPPVALDVTVETGGH